MMWKIHEPSCGRILTQPLALVILICVLNLGLVNVHRLGPLRWGGGGRASGA